MSAGVDAQEAGSDIRRKLPGQKQEFSLK